MQVCFRRLVLWQAAAVAVAAWHAPTVCSLLAEFMPRTSQRPMQPAALALITLQGLLVPLVFCNTLERLARMLYFTQAVQRS